MSRIAKYPIPLPKGVDVTLAAGTNSVKGPHTVGPVCGVQRRSGVGGSNDEWFTVVADGSSVRRTLDARHCVLRWWVRRLGSDDDRRGTGTHEDDGSHASADHPDGDAGEDDDLLEIEPATGTVDISPLQARPAGPEEGD